jgi:lipoprotein-anchoring transpeptidase ErfK/SrfK
VNRRRATLIALPAAATALVLLIAPAGASAQDPSQPAKQTTSLELKVQGKNGRVLVGRRPKVSGTLKPFAADQQVEVTITRGDKVIKKQVVNVHADKQGDAGDFHLRSPKLIQPGNYKATAAYYGNDQLNGSNAESKGFTPRYPSLNKGNRGSEVNLFNRLLAKQGYATSHGKKYTQTTAWGVLAFRKVHGMKRVQSATSGIFKALAEGRGAYEVQHPGAGKHAEVSLAKQVLVLADGDKPVSTYHISSGTIATPSDPGGYRFYRRQPGFNSLGMYYSTYYHGGEAIHGYHSVPTHPASHGCIRVPIPQAREIYNWVQLGMPIWVY